MPITALALLRIAQPATHLRVQALSDSVIVHTELDFAAEPAQLSIALADQLGEPLREHQDPRGILFIPSVAAPTGGSYQAVVAEVGEGGVWGPLPLELSTDSVQQSDFGDLLGSMLAQLPPSLLASAQAAASGDRAALGAMGAQVQSLLGGAPELSGLTQQLSGLMAHTAPPVGAELDALEQMFSGFGASEAAQSSLREMVLGMQAELMRDPSKLETLAKQLFSAGEPEKK
jgi:hypothetical protein